MRRILSALVLAAALAGPRPAASQGAPNDALPNTAAPATAASAAAAQSAPQQGAFTGIPQREAPPRTLRAYWHVFIAFAIAWALLFGYAISLGRRFARVERELERLGGRAA